MSLPVVSTIASVSKLAIDVASLLDEYPAAWKPCLPGQLPGHYVEHVIETEEQPLYACPSHLDQVKLAFAKAEFQNMEAEGFICCSDSPWASPLHMVPKPDGSRQPCSNYHHLTMLPGQILTLSPTFVISQTIQRVAQFFQNLT